MRLKKPLSPAQKLGKPALACAGSLLLATSLASCTVGPDYLKPEAPTPAKFKELAGWKKASPRDGLDRGAWWSVYKDGELNRLLPQVEVNNQTVASALAAMEQAQALTRELQASLFPLVSANYSVTRAGEGRNVSAAGRAVAATNFYPQGTVSWTLDVWGKVRRQIESNVALTQADAGLLANAKLSAQAQLAIAYFNLRTEDTLKDLLQRTVKIYKETLKITRNQYNGGTVSKADLITAENQVLTTEAQAIGVDVPRRNMSTPSRCWSGVRRPS